MPRSASEVVVDKFGGSVLRRPEDIAAAVAVVERQRAAGLRPVVVVSAFEGVTDTILSAARVLVPDGAWLRGPTQEADSRLARETDRALATGEALSAALFALEGRGDVTAQAVAASFMTLSVLTVPHILVPALLARRAEWRDRRADQVPPTRERVRYADQGST